MPAPESQQDERRDTRLTTGLFWGGVGLAPLAALLLLLGQEGGALRVAAVLAILAVVLIGLSITLRGNSDAVRVELEEVLYEEIDALRNDVREDIGTAARATHKAFGEKLQALYEQVNALRAQLDAIRAEAGRAGFDRPAPAPAAPHQGVTGAIGQAVGGRPAAGGVVRHTETVQVTTRQTIVDPGDDGDRGGTVYGGTVYGRHGEPDDVGWSEQRPRAEGRRARSYDEEPAYDERWSDVRAGDRWGSVRDDDRGREVRVGERRAAIQSDDAGTELRFEDRWASVRRDEHRRDEPRRDEHRRDEHRRDDAWRDEPARDRWADDRAGWQADRDGWRDDRAGWQDDAAGRRAGSGWHQEAGWQDDRAGTDDRDGWREDAGRRDQQAWGAHDRSAYDPADRAGHASGYGAGDPTGYASGYGSGDRYGDSADRYGADAGDDRWGDGDGAGWEQGRWSGRDDPAGVDAGWDSGRRAVAALPAGGQQQGIWDGDWVGRERQPVGGRRRRDEDTGHRDEAGDRWR
jgi:hypothetical protein